VIVRIEKKRRRIAFMIEKGIDTSDRGGAKRFKEMGERWIGSR